MKRTTVLGSAEIDTLLERLAGEILANHKNLSKLALVGIHTRGVPLAGRLREIIARNRSSPCLAFGSIDINLYRDDWTRISRHPEVRGSDIAFPVDDTQIILVDDVLYTGRTIRAAMEALMDYGRPDRIELCVLVDRGHRELPIQADYTGKSIPTGKNESVTVMLSEHDGTNRVDIVSA